MLLANSLQPALLLRSLWRVPYIDRENHCIRRVMANAHSRRGQRFQTRCLLRTAGRHRWRLIQHNPASDGLDLFCGNRAGPVKNDRFLANFNDRGLDAAPGRPGIQHQVDAAIQIVQNVLRRGRAGVSEAIRARRCKRHASGSNQGVRNGVRWHAHAYQSAPCCHCGRHSLLFGQQQRQRARPERVH
jgi:hypothetical protein